MAKEVASLLTLGPNFAVVQLPHRKFPGVVFQGDSLASLCHQAAAIARDADGTAMAEDAMDVSERLNAVLRLYVQVLTAHGIDLPFPSRPQEVWILDPDRDRATTIETICRMSTLDPEQVAEMLEGVPTFVSTVVDEEGAQRWLANLRASGAEAELRDITAMDNPPRG